MLQYLIICIACTFGVFGGFRESLNVSAVDVSIIITPYTTFYLFT